MPGEPPGDEGHLRRGRPRWRSAASIFRHGEDGRAARSDLEHPHDTQDGVPAISPATLQLIGCNATISTMIHDTNGDVLDAGRRSRKPSAALRRTTRPPPRHLDMPQQRPHQSQTPTRSRNPGTERLTN
jgi:hypothetical protein